MKPEEIIKGSCDLHVHSGPALVPRGVDHVEAVRACAEAGMRALVIKDQHVPSGNVAQVLQKYFVKDNENFNVYGGLVLGNTQGGLNPAVVEAAIGYDIKIVWMPVLSAQYHKERTALMNSAATSTLPKPKYPLKFNPPQTILDSCGRLLPPISDILKLIADADIILATGHLDPTTEVPLLLDEALKQGVKKIVITHPEFFKDHTIEQMRAYSDAGFIVEHILATIYSKKQTYDELFALVQEGGKNVIISSDLGQVGRPNPVVGLTCFVEEMQNRGMSDETLRRIMCDNQRKLLGLEPLAKLQNNQCI